MRRQPRKSEKSGPRATAAADTPAPDAAARVDVLATLERYVERGSCAWEVLLDHSQRVRDRALAAAAACGETVDVPFVEEAAMLHDIGIVATHAPEIGCHGDLPYICHGVVGRGYLEACGLPRHALVCERHTGTGLTAHEIRRAKLPLPARDMCPQSLEETIVCYADKFYSKAPGRAGRARTLDEVVRKLRKRGQDKVDIFLAWHARFG